MLMWGCTWRNVKEVRLSFVMLDLRLVLICFRALKNLSDKHEVSIRTMILMLTKYDEQRGEVNPENH